MKALKGLMMEFNDIRKLWVELLYKVVLRKSSTAQMDQKKGKFLGQMNK